MICPNDPTEQSIKAGYAMMFIASGLMLCLVSTGVYCGYKVGYKDGINSVRTEDMKELVTLRQKLEKSTSSIIVLKCEQQKIVQHKLRKGKVKDSIMSERSLDAAPTTGN